MGHFRGNSVLTCKKGGDPVWLHDSVVCKWMIV